jgi:hypothetical protein
MSTSLKILGTILILLVGIGYILAYYMSKAFDRTVIDTSDLNEEDF